VSFISIIIKNLLRRKGRTTLTCVGVAVAIAVMVMLVGVADGFERASAETFTQHGVDIVVMEARKPNQFDSDLDESLADDIRKLPGVKDVAGALVELAYTRTESGNDLSVVVMGWQPGSFQFDKFDMLAGRKFEPGDTKVALIGEVMAKNLHKDVGDTLELHEEVYKIVGRFKTINVFENGGVVIPLKELQILMSRQDSVSAFGVILEEQASVSADEVCKKIEALQGKRPHVRPSAQQTQSYIDSSLHIRMIRSMAWLTTLIAIISGTVSTLNTMTMSVFERFREIGTLRAIGWRRSRIVRMIIGESLVLSLIAAVVAIVGSVILMQVLTILPETSGFIDGQLGLYVIAQGLLIAVLVGIFGGIVPAYRAARLLPTEALRYE
jgi:putative ABC transport system permease protein